MGSAVIILPDSGRSTPVLLPSVLRETAAATVRLASIWRRTSSISSLKLKPLLEPRPPASEADVAQAEARLGVRLPDQLRRFLMQSNGAAVAARPNSGGVISRASPLVWSIDEIVRDNEPSKAVRQTEDVLFFANAGADGVLLGHPYEASGTVRDDVVAWYPIEARTTPLTTSFTGAGGSARSPSPAAAGPSHRRGGSHRTSRPPSRPPRATSGNRTSRG